VWRDKSNQAELFQARFAHYQVKWNFEGKEDTTMKTKTNVKAGGFTGHG